MPILSAFAPSCRRLQKSKTKSDNCKSIISYGDLEEGMSTGGTVTRTENNLLSAIMGAGEVDTDDLSEVE